MLRKRFVERTAAAVQLFNLDLFLVNVDCLVIGIVGKYLFSVQGWPVQFVYCYLIILSYNIVNERNANN